MDIIRIDPEDIFCDEEMAEDYIKVLNGIIYSCVRYDEYSEGNRNKVALDLTVACYELGLDALEVLDKLVKIGAIDPQKDDEAPIIRVERALNYSHRFDWDYMIDPEDYVEANGMVLFEFMPFRYELSK